MTKDAYCTENIPKLKLIIVVLSFGLIATNVYWLYLFSLPKYELLEVSVINEVQSDGLIDLVIYNYGYFDVELLCIQVNDEYVSLYTFETRYVDSDSSLKINVNLYSIFDMPPMNHIYHFLVYTLSNRVYWCRWEGLP